MTGRRLLIAIVTAVAAVTMARSGHELPVYPSDHPHEITLLPVGPGRAAELLLSGKIQAYVGGAPHFAAAPPASIESIESLGSFIVVRLNTGSPLIRDAGPCAAAEVIVRSLVDRSQDFIAHPYPITPFHGDYLHHVDLAGAAKVRILDRRSDQPEIFRTTPKIRSNGHFAESLAPPEWRANESEWDAELQQVDAAQLIAASRLSTNGWTAPAGLRSGWYQAFLLLSEDINGAERRSRIHDTLRRIEETDYETAVERINLERALVTDLAGDCHALVAGYTVKREYFSTLFTAGIENISYDALDGFNSPMFVRTVKLKDFPWNGWLTLGVATPPTAAWNPIAGFTDEFGRLTWSAVGDPASIPSPNDVSWLFNRVTSVQSNARK